MPSKPKPKEKPFRMGKSLKARQSSLYVTLRAPDCGINIENSRDCWHEGPWLYFKVRATDGSYNVTKVPIWRVVSVGWREESEL